MAQRVIAELKQVLVVWKGRQKTEKTGKEWPVLQIETTADDGRKNIMYVQGNEEIEKLVVGERVNLTCSIKAWQNNIYMFCQSWVKSVDDKKVRV